MTKKIPIRNKELPKNPRVFDVTVNEVGDILRYDMKNIKGAVFIDEKEVKRQIKEVTFITPILGLANLHLHI